MVPSLFVVFLFGSFFYVSCSLVDFSHYGLLTYPKLTKEIIPFIFQGNYHDWKEQILFVHGGRRFFVCRGWWPGMEVYISELESGMGIGFFIWTFGMTEIRWGYYFWIFEGKLRVNKSYTYWKLRIPANILTWRFSLDTIVKSTSSWCCEWNWIDILI